jgi:alpha-tubulin suppressor-like RCC1 family protein
MSGALHYDAWRDGGYATDTSWHSTGLRAPRAGCAPFSNVDDGDGRDATGAAAPARENVPPVPLPVEGDAGAQVWHVGPTYARHVAARRAPKSVFWDERYELDGSAAAEQPVPSAFDAAAPPWPPPAGAAAAAVPPRPPLLVPHDPSDAVAPRGAPWLPPAVRPFGLPLALPLPRGARVAAAAAGAAHALLLTREGELLSLGANAAGQLGCGDRVPALAAPRRAGGAVLRGARLAAVAAHGHRSAALSAAGDVARWGDDSSDENFSSSSSSAFAPLPRWLQWLDGAASTRVSVLALGARHALLLTSCGGVFALGAGCVRGELGVGRGVTDAPRPRRLERLRGLRVCALAAGASHSAAVTQDGCLFTWGCADDGRLGHGSGSSSGSGGNAASASLPDCFEPLLVRHAAWAVPASAAAEAAADADAAEAAAQRRRTALLEDPRTRRLALLRRGARAAAAPFAQPTEAHIAAALRHGGGGGAERFNAGAAAAPREATSAAGEAAPRERVVAVACGGAHTLALTAAGDVYAFGAGAQGQLGGGGTGAVGVPRRLRALTTSGVLCARIAAGEAHSAALTTDGRALVWGAGAQGQLGRGTTADALVPIALPAAPRPAGSAADVRAAAAAAADADAAAAHPLAGVRLGGVACGAACTLFWSADGARVWAAGAGAFGLPGQGRAATAAGAAVAAPLAGDAAGRACFAAAALRALRPGPGARPLLASALRAGPFEPPALAHILRTLLVSALAAPQAAPLLADACRELMAQAVEGDAGHSVSACSFYAFRRALVDALEDVGVRLLAAAAPAYAAALPAAPAAAAVHRGGGGSAAEGAAALRGLLRALLLRPGLLSHEDVADLADGCPASAHSSSLIDSALAGRKAAFFRSALPEDSPLLAPPPPPPPLHAAAAACAHGTEAEAWRAAEAASAARRAAAAQAPPLPESALCPRAPHAARVPPPPPPHHHAAAPPPGVTAHAEHSTALRQALLSAAASGVPRAELAALGAFAAAPTGSLRPRDALPRWRRDAAAAQAAAAAFADAERQRHRATQATQQWPPPYY